jgi:hypothetical protein
MIKKILLLRRDSSRKIKTYYEKTCLEGSMVWAPIAMTIYGTAGKAGKRYDWLTSAFLAMDLRSSSAY